MTPTSNHKKHFDLTQFGETTAYGYIFKGGDKQPPWPERDRFEHGSFIKNSFEQAITNTINQTQQKLIHIDQTANGYILVVECINHPAFNVEMLIDKKSGIQLLSLSSQDNGHSLIRLFIPLGAEKIYAQWIQNYLENNDASKKKKKPSKA